jgi:hypothetical protein
VGKVQVFSPRQVFAEPDAESRRGRSKLVGARSYTIQHGAVQPLAPERSRGHPRKRYRGIGPGRAPPVSPPHRQQIRPRLRGRMLVMRFDIGISSPSTDFFAAYGMVTLRPAVPRSFGRCPTGRLRSDRPPPELSHQPANAPTPQARALAREHELRAQDDLGPACCAAGLRVVVLGTDLTTLPHANYASRKTPWRRYCWSASPTATRPALHRGRQQPDCRRRVLLPA